MNNKLGIVLALLICVAVGISVYFWQESRISSLLNENKQLEENIKALEMTPETTEDQKSNFIETKQETITDNFKYDEKNYDYYGKLVVHGYATQQERPEFPKSLDVCKEVINDHATQQEKPEAFCEENYSEVTYVFFNVLNTDNKFFDDYIGKRTGNSFVGESSIGIGCVEENVLWRWNHSDQFGMKKYIDSLETSMAMLNSNKENPITIELERYLFTGGAGAPACYSHFAQLKILK